MRSKYFLSLDRRKIYTMRSAITEYTPKDLEFILTTPYYDLALTITRLETLYKD